MPAFIKKPVVIQADRFFPDQTPWPAGVEFGLVHGLGECHHIMTLEGAHKVTPGDFVITGVKGERYPCKPDIFLQTYDPGDPEAADIMSTLIIEQGDGRAFCIECERILPGAESPRDHAMRRVHRVAMVGKDPVVDPDPANGMVGRFYASLMAKPDGTPMFYFGPVAVDVNEADAS